VKKLQGTWAKASGPDCACACVSWDLALWESSKELGQKSDALPTEISGPWWWKCQILTTRPLGRLLSRTQYSPHLFWLQSPRFHQ
jgi:hypothetical protein